MGAAAADRLNTAMSYLGISEVLRLQLEKTSYLSAAQPYLNTASSPSHRRIIKHLPYNNSNFYNNNSSNIYMNTTVITGILIAVQESDS